MAERCWSRRDPRLVVRSVRLTPRGEWRSAARKASNRWRTPRRRSRRSWSDTLKGMSLADDKMMNVIEDDFEEIADAVIPGSRAVRAGPR